MKASQIAGQSFHRPVLVNEVVRLFTENKDAVIYDGTVGGGGHAYEIVKCLSKKGLYIAVDRDEQALEFARARLMDFENVMYYHGAFNDFDGALSKAKVDYVDGIFMDLGVSSHQIDEDERGFAFREGVKLDMRMNVEDRMTASDILNNYSESELYTIFKKYGEERHSKCIARRVVIERERKPLDRTDMLMEIIRRCVGQKYLVKSYARIFQALRIEVNHELDILRDALYKSLDVLKPNGRLAVITYHSLEDRIVKQFIRTQERPCTCPPDWPQCVCGKNPVLKGWRPQFIVPGKAEIEENPRARSAKLRAGVKL